MFSDDERLLLNRIEDDHLLHSLESIRMAIEIIWDSNAPRIVHDYTDHGVKHSERVAHWAEKLLQASEGLQFSSEEIYLLLAAVYLHDIGMQVDIVKHTKIKSIATDLGAEFSIEFKAKTSSDYSKKEQWEIRKNHSYLSAAWIAYLSSNPDRTTLSNAVNEIPNHLMADLMDICLYHSKLSITECPILFRFDPSKNKQRIAAILRFADEMDIDRKRVIIEHDSIFTIDPSNGMYWWRHHITNVSMISKNVFMITIRLSPEDYSNLATYLQKIVITEFHTNNMPVIAILRQNGIPITIDAGSRVEKDLLIFEKLPNEIVNAIEESQTESKNREKNHLLALSDDIRDWLRVMHYDVGIPIQRDSTTVDMSAVLKQGFVTQRLIVRCIKGPILPQQIDLLYNLLDKNSPEGWLISDQNVAREALESLVGKKDLSAFSFSEFLHQKIWGPYFNQIRSSAQNLHIRKLYVDFSCSIIAEKIDLENNQAGNYSNAVALKQEDLKDDKGFHYRKCTFPSLDDYVDFWLKARSSNQLCLMGDFGSGKTWFSLHYAYRQLDRYLKNPAQERLPLLIPLNRFTKVMDRAQLINDTLEMQYKLPFIGNSFEIFQALNRRGKLLIILDGFDEMAQKADQEVIKKNLLEIAKLVDPSSKIILTSRTEYFSSAMDIKRIFDFKEYAENLSESSPPDFDVIYIEPFNDIQINEVLFNHLGLHKGKEFTDMILAKKNLVELARKPVILNLLVTALSNIDTDSLDKLNLSLVYLSATNELLLRRISDMSQISIGDKVYFLCELAWEMLLNEATRINHKNIPLLLNKLFYKRIETKEQRDSWEFEMKTNALLNMDPEGYLYFPHKSILEFFVALKYAYELDCIIVPNYEEPDGKPSMAVIKEKLLDDLAETFGDFSLRSLSMHTVRNFLGGLMKEDAPEKLWRIIDAASASAKMGFCGGNAATLLQDLGARRPHPYEDVTYLMEGMQTQSETIFHNRPADIEKVESELKRAGVANAKMEIINRDEAGFDFAILAYEACKNDDLKEASGFAQIAKSNNKKLGLFNLSIQAYAALQSMYMGDLPASKEYLEKFSDNYEIPEHKLWYHLKMGHLSLQMHDPNEAENHAQTILSNPLNDQKMMGRAFLLLGLINRDDLRSDYKRAITNFKKAIPHFTAANDLYHEGITLANMGIAYRMNNEFEKAKKNYDKALPIFSEGSTKDLSRKACVLARRGSAYRKLKKYDLSIDDYKQSIEIFRELGEDFLLAVVKRELAMTYLIVGFWKDAIENYKCALNILNFSKFENNPAVGLKIAQATYGIGLSHLMQGKWDGALTIFNEALKLFRKQKDTFNISLTLSSMGTVARMMDMIPESLEYFNEALKIVKVLGDRSREGMILAKLGSIYRLQSLYGRSIDCFNKSLIISRNSGNRLRQGRTLGSLGTVYRRRNELNEKFFLFSWGEIPGEGEKYLVKFLAEKHGLEWIKTSRIEKTVDNKTIRAYNERNYITLELNDKKNEMILKIDEARIKKCSAKMENNKLNIYYDLNDIEEAKTNYKLALEIFSELGDTSNSSWILEELGQIYVLQGSTNLAISAYGHTIDKLRSKNPKENKGNLADIAQSQIMTAFTKGTIEKYEAAGGEIEKLGNLALQAKTLRNLGEAYRLVGRFLTAESKLRESLEISNMIKDRDQEGKTLCYIGKAYASQKEFEEAYSYIKKAIKVFEDLGDHFLQSWGWETLGNVYLMNTDWQNAISANNAAVNLNSRSWSMHLSLAISYKMVRDLKAFSKECQTAKRLSEEHGINEYDKACLEAVSGDSQKAIGILRSLLARRKTSSLLVEQDPRFLFISEDPQFKKLLHDYPQIPERSISIVPFI